MKQLSIKDQELAFELMGRLIIGPEQGVESMQQLMIHYRMLKILLAKHGLKICYVKYEQ